MRERSMNREKGKREKKNRVKKEQTDRYGERQKEAKE